jgi:hypothetical protein
LNCVLSFPPLLKDFGLSSVGSAFLRIKFTQQKSDFAQPTAGPEVKYLHLLCSSAAKINYTIKKDKEINKENV